MSGQNNLPVGFALVVEDLIDGAAWEQILIGFEDVVVLLIEILIELLTGEYDLSLSGGER